MAYDKLKVMLPAKLEVMFEYFCGLYVFQHGNLLVVQGTWLTTTTYWDNWVKRY